MSTYGLDFYTKYEAIIDNNTPLSGIANKAPGYEQTKDKILGM